MPVAKSLVYYGSDTDADRLVSGKVEKRGSKRSLSLEQEFSLVLVRLQLGLLEVDLATRAGLSQSQLSRIFIIPNCDAIQFGLVENLLMKLCHHHLRRCIQQHGLSFTAQNCSLKLLALLELSVTYSNYKHHNTAKGLVGISPSAAVTLVSYLYPGRSRDKQITNDCVF